MVASRSVLRCVNTFAALAVTVGLLDIGARGIGPLPPVGKAFNPGTGVWTMASDAALPKNETLDIRGLKQPVTVQFDSEGTAYINAKTDHDLYLTMGYLHARDRLFQMDLMRRQGEGLLSQVVGKKALSSDEFEDQLGLERTAEAEWNGMTANDPARIALTAYAQGVNDQLSEEEQSGHLPAMFKLLGYTPSKWTPVDSLVIQGDMTQTLDFTTGPLEYALLVKSLGYQKTMDWFPVLPPDSQNPYDPGPYPSTSTAPIESQLSETAVAHPSTVSRGEAEAVTNLLHLVQTLPAEAIHHGSNSNNWAVDGSKTESGLPMLAGDPHLSQTLPSIWYQVSAKSPSYQFSGVSIPGLPIVLIGRNQNIAWSLTNVQNQATLYYHEQTDAEHPNQYYQNGAWHETQQMNYQIPVKGLGVVPFTVKLTSHGPIMTQAGQTLSVDWMGSLPSPDIDAMLGVVKSTNYSQFKAALSTWHAPTQNFIYADKKGNIGLISAGYYPIVKSGNPWLPLPGDGSADVVGTIPYNEVPQSYDPKSHILFSANQREVGPNYPYYIGTTMDFFDNGYRADEIHDYLSTHNELTTEDFEALQNDTKDYLAGEIVPKLLSSLSNSQLSPTETEAKELLQEWNDHMDTNSAAATIWWSFWSEYLQDTFGPWWTAKNVPITVDPNLDLGPGQTSLDEDLENWTLSHPEDSSFDLPDGTKRTSDTVMTQAFNETIAQLTKQLGADPEQWTWGQVHSRAFPSLAQIGVLGYGPYPSGGDMWTVDAADGSMTSTAGPSWRMIVNFGGQDEGIYPGGQSENPLSPWYENQVSDWWNGRYAPIAQSPSESTGLTATWSLKP